MKRRNDNIPENQLIDMDITWKEKKAMILAAYSVVLPIAMVFFVVYFFTFLLMDIFWL